MAAPDGAIFPANPHFRLVGWSWKLREDKVLSEPGFLGYLSEGTLHGRRDVHAYQRKGREIHRIEAVFPYDVEPVACGFEGKYRCRIWFATKAEVRVACP